MSLKQYKPTINSRRHASVLTGAELTGTKPVKRLLIAKKRGSGRNNQGKITVRHRGGGHKRFLRIVDWRRDRYDAPATVRSIEYDPNRSARIILLEFSDNEKRYMLAPDGVQVGSVLHSSRGKVEAAVGNRMPLEFIPVGLLVHAIEFSPGRGGTLVRAAGMSAQLLGVEGGFAILKLPSGESRMVSKDCAATIGVVGNSDHRLVRLGKAGRMRHRGFRPRVRGKAMNPVDHPHGGGEGRNSIGLKYPKTPWGKHALGVRTRDPKKWTSVLIQKRRK